MKELNKKTHNKDGKKLDNQPKWKSNTKFDSFCTRMWLDYCDENNDPLSAPNRLERESYVEKYHDWLMERFKESGQND